MKEHRSVFEGSSAQVACRRHDRYKKFMNITQIDDRQHNRFNSMLNEQYGGRKAVRTFLRTGRLEDFRLPPLREDIRPRGPPQRRSKAYANNEKYYYKLYLDMMNNVRGGRKTNQWDNFKEQVAAGAYFKAPRDASWLWLRGYAQWMRSRLLGFAQRQQRSENAAMTRHEASLHLSKLHILDMLVGSRIDPSMSVSDVKRFGHARAGRGGHGRGRGGSTG